MATPEITQNTSNPFDAPIPGQSLTDTPGNYPWEHPPQFTDVKEASEYVWDRLHDNKLADQIITMLKEGIPVEALARMVIFGGFVEGKWTVDMAILLSEIVFKQITAIGMKSKIKELKLFMGDQSNNKFHMDFAKFKASKEKGKAEATPKQTNAEKFAEEIKAELKNKSPSGLMNKETD